MQPAGVTKKVEKGQTFMRQTGYLPQPPTSTYPLQFWGYYY